MDNNDLPNLDLQIEYLIRSYKQLKNENSSLRQNLIKLTKENADLVDRNKRAVASIKHIISQLRMSCDDRAK
jgi:uncharacterized protein (TIGR02449 family)